MASASKLVGGRLCFPLLGAVTGLVVAPAAGAVTCLRALGPPRPGSPGRPPGFRAPERAVLVSAAGRDGDIRCGRGRDRASHAALAARGGTCRLAVAGEGLVAAYVAGPFATGPVLAGVSVPLAAG